MTEKGFDEAGLARMERVMRGDVPTEVPGYVYAVHRKGQTVLRTHGTFGANGAGAAMAQDTIFRVASITKPVTAAAAMMLVEDGVLTLDGPVDPFLPELANRKVLKRMDSPLDDTEPARRPISLRDLLTMRMGLGAIMVWPSAWPIQHAMDERGVSPGPVLFAGSSDDYMKGLADLPLVHQPGEGWLYDTGLNVAGILIARASGKKLSAFMEERIFGPLGMVDTAFFVPEQKRHRLSDCYTKDQATGAFNAFDPSGGSGFLSRPAHEAGNGGLVSTVPDFLAFMRMLHGFGEADGRRVLSRQTVELMRTDAIAPAHKAAQPFFFGEGGGWGLGMSVATKKTESFTNAGRFGWDGGFGTSAYSDPVADLTGVLFTQRTMDSPVAPKVFNDFWTQAYAAIGS
ncbi:MAG: beta-lactamase family protein [Rhizobiaceae bacterium]|nr:beta-lactamase family protein [Rhizobiaceae bacterium]